MKQCENCGESVREEKLESGGILRPKYCPTCQELGEEGRQIKNYPKEKTTFEIFQEDITHRDIKVQDGKVIITQHNYNQAHKEFQDAMKKIPQDEVITTTRVYNLMETKVPPSKIFWWIRKEYPKRKFKTFNHSYNINTKQERHTEPIIEKPEQTSYDREESYEEFVDVMKDFAVMNIIIVPDSTSTDKVRNAMKDYGYNIPHSTITGWIRKYNHQLLTNPNPEKIPKKVGRPKKTTKEIKQKMPNKETENKWTLIRTRDGKRININLTTDQITDILLKLPEEELREVIKQII